MDRKHKNHRPAWKLDRDFVSYVSPVLKSGGIRKTDGFRQHGGTTRFSHCVSVAYYSLKAANFLRIRCDSGSLVRGALLHDYYLYDWREKEISHLKNAWIHPKVARHNAVRDYGVNALEQNIIVRHMFPVVPIPPLHVEGLIVCVADKLCGLAESFGINKLPLPGNREIWQDGNNYVN